MPNTTPNPATSAPAGRLFLADHGSAERIGSLPALVALGATADIGTATIEGRSVFITWGRNLTDTERVQLARRFAYDFIRIAPTARGAEFIIPDDDARRLLRAIDDTTERAIERVRTAGVKADDATIRRFVKTAGPAAVLAATYRNIRDTARMF